MRDTVPLPDTDWHVVEKLIFKVTLLDGSRARGYLMARRIMGQWQYRRATEREISEYKAHMQSW